MAKFDGRWKMTVKTFMGDQSSLVELRQQGNTLVGTVTDGGNGSSAEIQNGRVEGDSFGYSVTLRVPIGEITNEIAGTINAEGNRLTGTSKNAMGEFEIVADKE